MNTRLQNLAAAHGALWSGDPWYRRSWFIWPLAMALLAAGWLTFHGAPAGKDSHAPWAVPAQEALSPHDMDMLRDSAKTDVAAFERLKTLAASGDKNAQFSLGTLYDPQFNFSKLTNPDVNQAIAWYTKAAEQGQMVAQNNLGNLFYNGKFDVAQNFSTAFFWYQKSAAQGYALGERGLANCYLNGHGVAANPIRATELFQSAANKGEADAQNHIGWLYYQGNGVAQDYAQAMSWYRKAADQGHADAQNNVGWLYYHGNGVAQDYAQAMFWYRKAADQGHAEAEANIGALFEEGNGVEKNVANAIIWFRKAADRGNDDAKAALKRLSPDVTNGGGAAPVQSSESQRQRRRIEPAQEALSTHAVDMLRDSAKTDAAAFERLKTLAASGDKNAQFSLGTLYDPRINFSKLTNPDVNQAIAWYTKAAEQGQGVAQSNLGDLFNDGKWGTQNFSTAFFWFQKAANNGIPNAQNNLGIAYAKGQGVAQNMEQARLWFTRAKANGNADAANNLLKLP